MDVAPAVESLPITEVSVTSELKLIEKNVNEIINAEGMTPEEYCRRAKIDLLDIYKELGDIALNAKITAKDKYGDVVVLGSDNRARMSAISLILELNKHIKDKSVVINNGIFNSADIEKETERVLSLRKLA